MSGYVIEILVELFANSGDPDQTPRSVASDLGLYCLPITLYGSPDYNWLKGIQHTVFKMEDYGKGAN